jgi:hypothetical protein
MEIYIYSAVCKGQQILVMLVCMGHVVTASLLLIGWHQITGEILSQRSQKCFIACVKQKHWNLENWNREWTVAYGKKGRTLLYNFGRIGKIRRLELIFQNF